MNSETTEPLRSITSLPAQLATLEASEIGEAKAVFLHRSKHAHSGMAADLPWSARHLELFEATL